MRLRRTSAQSHGFHGINATPLIDVVMCLIIFFLLVGKLAVDQGGGVLLPKSGAGKTDPAENMLTVNIAPVPAEGMPAGVEPWAPGATATVLGQLVPNPGAMEALVREKLLTDQKAVVQIRAHRDLPFAAVEPVIRACGRGGATTIRLVTEKVE
jgi:biopolymer transport protein ExbD